MLTTEVGYSGGFIPYPCYRLICSGATGHAEVVKISFDPEEISIAHILDAFFLQHDPTQKNR